MFFFREFLIRYLIPPLSPLCSRLPHPFSYFTPHNLLPDHRLPYLRYRGGYSVDCLYIQVPKGE